MATSHGLGGGERGWLGLDVVWGVGQWRQVLGDGTDVWGPPSSSVFMLPEEVMLPEHKYRRRGGAEFTEKERETR